jgi:hypothetical protein
MGDRLGIIPLDPLHPSLYGITHSNRTGAALWGKNQFNSTFPTALACYMRDKGIPAVYLTLGEDLKVRAEEISIDALFNSERPNDQLQFDFEISYEPYQQYAFDAIGGIDLVVKHHGDNTEATWRRPLEVKLTVVPDNKTSRRPEAEWGPELVIRPASIKYCALGIYHNCREQREQIRDLFEDVCANFQLWSSAHELLNKRRQLLESLNNFQQQFRVSQQPFLIQPIWKTQGKSPRLSENAFDLFVWSDFALCRAVIDKSLEEAVNISRFMRAAARLARIFYVLSTQGRANLLTIYNEMGYGHQTDKDLALPGDATRGYLDTPRRVTPILPREAVANIILNGGEKLLSPERRLDATLYFSAGALFGQNLP